VALAAAGLIRCQRRPRPCPSPVDRSPAPRPLGQRRLLGPSSPRGLAAPGRNGRRPPRSPGRDHAGVSTRAWPTRHSRAATETKPSGERCRRRCLRQCWSPILARGLEASSPCRSHVPYSRSCVLPERSARPGLPWPSPPPGGHSATARPFAPAILPAAGSIGGASPPTVAASAAWCRHPAGLAAGRAGCARNCAATGVERQPQRGLPGFAQRIQATRASGSERGSWRA